MRFITKNLSNTIFKRCFILTILLIIYILISAISYTKAVSKDISNSVFRLHVIANSDSDEDQNLKYLVRDKVLNYMNSLSSQANSKEEVIKLAKENIETLKYIAQQTILENGFDYNVDLEIGNFSFPTKKYGDITLPPGYYDALKIKIGNAEGQNWWCVMFPPLCFVDVSNGIVPDESKQMIQENLSEEEYSLVSDNSNFDLKLKFKIIEVLQNFNISGIFM